MDRSQARAEKAARRHRTSTATTKHDQATCGGETMTQQQPNPYQPMQQERNYTAAAWLSAGLTFLFVVPGLIATIINLIEANGVRKRTGITPQGYGCLWAVLIWCAIPFIIFLVIAAIFAGSISFIGVK